MIQWYIFSICQNKLVFLWTGDQDNHHRKECDTADFCIYGSSTERLTWRAVQTVVALLKSNRLDEPCEESLRCQRTVPHSQGGMQSIVQQTCSKAPEAVTQGMEACWGRHTWPPLNRMIQFRQGSKLFVPPVWGADLPKHLLTREVVTFNLWSCWCQNAGK